jgi:hypothetical protein
MRKPALALLVLAAACNRPPADHRAGISPAAPTSADDLTAVTPSPAVDPNGDSVTYIYAWSVNGSSWGSDQIVPADQTTKGDTWTLSIVPTDGELEGEAAIAEVVIGNSIPETVAITFDPEIPAVDDDVVAVPETLDIDGDTLTYVVSWSVDGLATGFDELTLPASATAKGEVWTVTLSPDDGEPEGAGLGEPVSADVSIDNSAPVMLTASFTPADEGYEDTVFTATATAEDADGDELDLIYSWMVDGEVAKSSTQPSFTGTGFNRTETVTLSVHANDGFLDSEPLAAEESVLILNSVPSVASVDINPASIYEASIANCLPQEWDDPDPLDLPAYTFSWSVNTVEVSTSQTLDGADFNKHDVLVCTAVPYDSDSQGDAVAALPVTVSNTAPVLTAAALSTTSPTRLDTLSVTVSGVDDDDDDPVTSTYAWWVDGSEVATTETLSGDLYERGDEVYVMVTPVDDEGLEGTAVKSDTATVANGAPEVTDLLLTPSDAVTKDPVVATLNTTDPDGDNVSVVYTWTINGTVDTAVTTATLSKDKHVKDDVIGLTVTPTDTQGLVGSTVTATTLTIANTPPTFTKATISPTSPTVADTLTCTSTGWKDDDAADTEGYLYVWNDGDGATLGTLSSLTAPAFSKGDSVTCTSTAWDGDDEGTEKTSTSVSIGNSSPEVTSVSISPTTAYEDTVLTASVATSDADGDTVSVDLKWYAGATLVGSGTTLDGDDFDRDDVVRVKATPSDGTNGTAVLSTGVTILNTAPAISGVSLSPALPNTAATLTATVTDSDLDDDSITNTFVWVVGGTDVLTTSLNTLDSSYTEKHDVVGIRVTPSDGTLSGSTYTLTAGVTVQNSAPTQPTIALEPALAMAGVHDLQCAVETESTDLDGDTITYSFDWVVDSGGFSGTTTTNTYSGDAVASTNTFEAEQWECSATANDSEEDGDTDDSDVVVILPECDNDDTWSTTDKTGGTNSRGVTVYDVDQDGNDDIAFCNLGDDDTQIYFGNGSGAFNSYNTYSVGGVTKCVAFGDIDGDDKVDMVSASRADGKFYVIEGNGGGTFKTAFTNVSQSGDPTWVDLIDIDDDGDLDLVAALATSGCLARRLNDGSGSFASSACIVSGVTSRPIGGDFDNDGVAEMMYVDGGSIYIVEFTSSGGVASTTTLSVSSLSSVSDVYAYDIDDDGDDDIIAFGTSATDGTDAMVTYLDYFDDYSTLTECDIADGLSEVGMGAGDFDDDGTPDFAVASECTSCTSTYTIYLND